VDARHKAGHDDREIETKQRNVIASEAKQSSFLRGKERSWIASSLRSSQ
jgi:hypothetical protein